MTELQNTLPPGWDCQMDKKTGKYYFINHYTKTTTWEDPRLMNKPHHAAAVHRASATMEYIPLQHGSPEFRRNYVYPSQTTPIPAFQIPAHYSPKSIPLQDLGKSARGTPRATTSVQDSSLSIAANTEEAVAKISAMFPTVSDTHIRILLKKYHNREALVISALQVEKHPITTPGPFATPPPARSIHQVHAPLQMTPPVSVRLGSRGGSPVLRPGSGSSSSYTSEPYRSSPKPHSPKLKLRYMKSIFPKAEETIILDILSSNDNNIQKASEVLLEMGFQKRDSAKALHRHGPKLELSKPREQPRPQAQVPPKPKTPGEKKRIKTNLQEKYKDTPEQVVTIALESADFDEDRANQILQIMVQEENNKNQAEEESKLEEVTEVDAGPSTTVPQSQSRQSLKSLLKTEKSDYSLKERTFSRVIEESDMENSYRSPNLANTKGADRKLVKGANQELLLEDYVNWHGPELNLRTGSVDLAKGPDSSLLSSRTYQPCGPNAGLRKGPKLGLAKGSIFAQLKGAVVGESRGK